ncbi:MAG: 50S ribosomal protein L17 [Acidobacteria bacterium]|nr:50S ribosomal protein L17 [Acidobacteriota bacterium]
MRHNKAGYKLKRDVSARRALLRNIVTSVILEERVVTTVPKAKAAKPIVDQIITLAKREDQLHARRQAASYLLTPASVQKLFDKIGPRFAARNGGYTRVVRVGFRKGDGAETAVLELVGSELVRRSADRAKRREEKLKAMQEGREGGEPAES